MIDLVGDEYLVTGPESAWCVTQRSDRAVGPDKVTFKNTPVLQRVNCYVDDMFGTSAVLDECRVHRRAGAAVVSGTAKFPFGAQVKFVQTLRCASAHLRGTFDLQWPRRAVVRRHFGVLTAELPGDDWKRLHVIPPASHSAAGKEAVWQDLPKADEDKDIMVGHWHRPPLALIFERADGVRVEIGTGDDLWRWEQCLGAGPENGSYKVFRTRDGLRLAWEPLMTCAEFAPACREYRFNWYAAWSTGPSVPKWASSAEQLQITDKGDLELGPAMLEASSVRIDFATASWKEEWRRASGGSGAYIRGVRGEQCCWQCAAVQKRARRMIRQLASAKSSGCLVLAGIDPGPCWDPLHLKRRDEDGAAHWDMTALIDFSVWARQTLGTAWEVYCEQNPERESRPILDQMFGLNGFAEEDFAE